MKPNRVTYLGSKMVTQPATPSFLMSIIKVLRVFASYLRGFVPLIQDVTNIVQQRRRNQLRGRTALPRQARRLQRMLELRHRLAPVHLATTLSKHRQNSGHNFLICHRNSQGPDPVSPTIRLRLQIGLFASNFKHQSSHSAFDG